MFDSEPGKTDNEKNSVAKAEVEFLLFSVVHLHRWRRSMCATTCKGNEHLVRDGEHCEDGDKEIV